MIDTGCVVCWTSRCLEQMTVVKAADANLAICNHSDSRKLPTSHQGRGCGRIMARRVGTPELQVRGWGERSIRSETLCSSTITKHTLYSLYFDIIKLLRSRHGYLTTAAVFSWCCSPFRNPG